MSVVYTLALLAAGDEVDAVAELVLMGLRETVAPISGSFCLSALDVDCVSAIAGESVGSNAGELSSTLSSVAGSVEVVMVRLSSLRPCEFGTDAVF